MKTAFVTALATFFGLSQCVVAFASLPTYSGAAQGAAQAYHRGHTHVNPSLRARSDHHEKRTVDEWVDEVTAMSATRKVTLQFSPSRWHLWSRFKGTVVQKTWKSVLFLTVFNAVLCFKVHIFRDLIPTFRMQMEMLDKLWHMQMTLTTFILAFFLNKSYTVWTDMLSLGRRIQGRLNDVSIMVSTHAKRDENGLVLPKAQIVIDTIARYKRLFCITFYASVVKTHAPLTTDEALAGFERKGLITADERALLAAMPPRTRHHAICQWLGNVVVQACEDDSVFYQRANLHFSFLDKMTQLRATYGSVPDKIDDRLNMAYAHFVQLLVDSFLIVTPFAALADMGNLSVFATAVLTMFFQGLLDLSKMFLDPYNNEGQGDNGDYLVVNTLIQETNAGSERFKDLTKRFPPSYWRGVG